jgi:gliding motility-associated lipoprotein GldD
MNFVLYQDQNSACSPPEMHFLHNLFRQDLNKNPAIVERVWKNEDEKVFALAYEIKGNTACNYAFTITDSSQHFFSGQLLFQTKPNYDSLKPCISFIIEDLEEMISSFQWVN